MAIEIEAKLKVDSHDAVAAALAALGARHIGRRIETDTFFDDGAIARRDKCLRLRTQTQDGDTRYILAFKGPKAPDMLKKRQEVQLDVHSRDDAVEFLGALGFRPVMVLQKRRSLWQFNRCEVALDEIPILGTYVEIEGPDNDTIIDTQRQLGLGHLSHIPRSYAGLIRAILEAAGDSRTEIFF